MKKIIFSLGLLQVILSFILLLQITSKYSDTHISVESHVFGGNTPRVEMLSYRLTSYYTNDSTGSGTCTASGICVDKFKVNDKGWYTYNGMIVVAAANANYIKHSKYPYNENIVYRKLYSIINIEIDGKWYVGVVLDICGSAMREQRIDLFVSSKEYAIDRGYKGKNMVQVLK